MQRTVNMVKASAGSGKTFRLTHEYVDRLLAGGADSHRHILAVTFTNKATAEMKRRIVEALSREAAGGGPRAAKAKAHLAALLHDYGAFGVSTIDAYLQGVMRAFAHETGQQASYRVELDTESVLEAVAERVMDAAAGDLALEARLKAIAMRQVEGGGSWDITPRIREAARRFLDERFLLRLRRHGSVVTDEAATDALAAEADARIRDFEGRLREAGARALEALQAAGREPESFKGKSRSPMTVLRKWAAGEVKEPPARLASSRDEAEEAGLDEAARAIDEAAALFGEPYREYRSLALVRDSIPLMALHACILRHLDAYLEEENAALLGRCGDRLAELLCDADMPYVAEKTGRRLDSILLDEAQDTSLLQWENLRPAIQEALSRGGDALVVGDVKQSIYRWRGGDWRLLDSLLERSLHEAAVEKSSLRGNWRSGRAIVEFNNRLFGGAAAVLRERGDEALAGRVEAIYGDCAQEVPEARAAEARDGLVKVRILEGEGWRDAALDAAALDIRGLHREGHAWGRITVLVRRNREGAEVARRLAAEGIPVVTDDALSAGSSRRVARAMTALRLRTSSAGDVERLAAEVLGMTAPQGETLAEAAAEAARAAQPEACDMPFMDVLLDGALAWQQAHGSDFDGFAQWWDKEGARKSVQAAEGQDAVRVMTIHKSKGLSLDAVIVPFACDAFNAQGLLAPTIWCEARGTLAPLGLVPLRAYGGRLAGTQFEDDFREERTCQWIDTLNTMYVALTRSRTRLFIYAPRETDDGKVPERFSGLLQAVLGDDLAGGAYETGEALPPQAAPQGPATRAIPAPGRAPRSREGLTLTLHGREYFDEAAKRKTQALPQDTETQTTTEP